MKLVMKLSLVLLVIAIGCISAAEAGILSWLLGATGGYAACQTACNAAWVSCYAAAGLVAGTVTAGKLNKDKMYIKIVDFLQINQKYNRCRSSRCCYCV